MSARLALIIDLGDDFAIAGPVPRSHLSALESLLGYLHQCWQQDNFRVSDRSWSVIERIAALMPRVDKPGTFGFDVRKLAIERAESLFLGQIVAGEIKPCEVLELHSFTVKTKPPKKEGEPLTPADISIESSGLPDADIFASLINLDESIEGAWRIWSTFDAQTINAIIGQLNELRRDPQERLTEYLNQRFEEWKRENQQTYLQALGIG
ncbi:hypothetical protein WA1_19040 [Scytonema hofmannii PCC 7110]|uniref:Uncharacterized protein n=1 Tax=Scytonema hofmannii PCC 7110 TaxID=128403 RepID=A0A139XBL7_9CYAN|nr:hypothetical protein [Scytonema hofmannii]KYC42097.1 hypothetical protein WA1_19040 [Scytonema hofmannii PCC 7110]